MKEPLYIMMIGIPGSGKSTAVYKITEKFSWSRTWMLLSTDNYIEISAKRLGKTYSDIFQELIKEAEEDLNYKRKLAIDDNMNIIHDQTNLSVKSRKQKLGNIPNFYTKIAMVVATPDDEELQRRLDSRPGKIIPPKIIEFMKAGFVYPTYNEGFDFIFDYDETKLNEYFKEFKVYEVT